MKFSACENFQSLAAMHQSISVYFNSPLDDVVKAAIFLDAVVMFQEIFRIVPLSSDKEATTVKFP